MKVPVTKGRYFCLEGLSSFDNTNIAAIAEFDVLDEKGEKISRENWKIVYADSEETRSGNRTADKIYDLQESTFWQTVDNTAYPHQVVIDLGKEYNVTGFRILPRAEQGAPGMIKDYKVYVKQRFSVIDILFPYETQTAEEEKLKHRCKEKIQKKETCDRSNYRILWQILKIARVSDFFYVTLWQSMILIEKAQ